MATHGESGGRQRKLSMAAYGEISMAAVSLEGAGGPPGSVRLRELEVHDRIPRELGIRRRGGFGEAAEQRMWLRDEGGGIEASVGQKRHVADERRFRGGDSGPRVASMKARPVRSGSLVGLQDVSSNPWRS